MAVVLIGRLVVAEALVLVVVLVLGSSGVAVVVGRLVVVDPLAMVVEPVLDGGGAAVMVPPPVPGVVGGATVVVDAGAMVVGPVAEVRLVVAVVVVVLTRPCRYRCRKLLVTERWIAGREMLAVGDAPAWTAPACSSRLAMANVAAVSSTTAETITSSERLKRGRWMGNNGMAKLPCGWVWFVCPGCVLGS